MRRLQGLRAAALSFLLSCLFASASLAVPVGLSVNTGQDGAFRFSFLHSAETSCQTITGIEFCMNGSSLHALVGTLSADLNGLVLSNLSGTILVNGGPDIVVTGGGFDFAGAAPDTFAGTIETSTHGTFSFFNRNFISTANSFDGTRLTLWGNNWSNPGTPDTGGFPLWGIDLGIGVLPEPGVAGLLILSGLGLARRRR